MSIAMPDSGAIADAAQWLFVAYFVSTHGGYLIVYMLSLGMLRRFMDTSALVASPSTVSRSEPPVSIIVPVHNTQETVAESVRALLQLDYSEYEVIVVNDGSRDGTLARLQREFALVLFPEAYWRRLKVKQIHGVYRSPAHPGLRVIDKSHGGTADALNAGINAARYPLFCPINAASILRRDSLRRVVKTYLDRPATIASLAMVRISNGCTVIDGFLDEPLLPSRLIEVLQILERLRAHIFGRLGWSTINAVLAVTGAFGVLRKESVMAAGGYRTGIEGAETELLVRLHRIYRLARTPYRIALVPDPVCWIRAPVTLKALRGERLQWQRGLTDALAINAKLLFHPRGGTPGWLAFPFVALFECLGPLMEVMAYAVMIAGYASTLVPTEVFVAFLIVAVGLGTLLSATALLLEQSGFRSYRRASQLAVLMLAALLENLGYRQLIALWRIGGLPGSKRRARLHAPKAQSLSADRPQPAQPRDRPSGSGDT